MALTKLVQVRKPVLDPNLLTFVAYAKGTVVSDSDVVAQGSRLYKFKGTAPYTLTGTWSTDVAQFMPFDQLDTLAQASGATMIGYENHSFRRTVYAKLTDVLSAKDFGVLGDGSTNDTANLQKAIDTAASEKRALFLPSGVYMVTTLTVRTHTHMYGEYIGDNGAGTVIRQISGNNGNVIEGENAVKYDQNSPAVTATDYAHHVTLHSMEIDGNINGVNRKFDGTGGTGIFLWGGSYNLFDLDIINCGGHGMYTAGKDMDVEWGHFFRESSFRNIRIRNIGRHGWWARGPHDSKVIDISIINASQSGNNTHDGFICQAGASFDITGMHVSVSGNLTGNYESIRHRYSGNFEESCRVSTSNFEGGVTPLRIASSYCQFDSSNKYYAPWGVDGGKSAIVVLLEGANLSTIKGTVSGGGAYKPNMVLFGVMLAAAHPTSGTVIDVFCEGISVPISFGNNTTSPDGDGGNNNITAVAFYNGSQNYATYGYPNTANGTVLNLQFSGSQRYVSQSQRQSTTFALAAGATFTWTFKYPFIGMPVVIHSIAGPSTDPTKPVWVTGADARSVSFYNGTGANITVHAVAHAPELI